MSFDRAVRYPTKWLPPSPSFPFGVPKNSTTEVSKDGSPFEKDFISDTEGFFQGMLFRRGISLSGNPDTALISDYLDSLGLLVGITHATIDDAINDATLKEGMRVSTADYDSTSRGGGGGYLMKTLQQTIDDNDDIDEGGNHTSVVSDLFLVLQPVNGEVNALQYGIPKDGLTDCGPATQSALEALGRDTVFVFPPKITYLFKTAVTVQKADSSITVKGYGAFIDGHSDLATEYIFNVIGDKATIGNSIHNMFQGFTFGLKGAKGAIRFKGCIVSVVKDMILREDFPAPGSPLANANYIFFDDCFNVTVDNVKGEQLNGTSGIGVLINSTAAEFPTNVLIQNSLIQNSWRNIAVIFAVGGDTVRIVNNGLGDSSSPNGENGIYIEGFVKALELGGNHFENTPIAVELNGDIDVDINNNHFSNVPVCYDFTGTGKANLENNSYITDDVADRIFGNNEFDVIQNDDPTITNYIKDIQSGFGTFRNLKRIYDIRTVTFTVLNTDDNHVFANNGGIQLATINLPLTSEVGAGFRVGFYAKEAQSMRIDPNPADKIGFLTDAVGDRISNNDVAETYVELISSGDGFWQPTNIVGTWSDVN